MVRIGESRGFATGSFDASVRAWPNCGQRFDLDAEPEALDFSNEAFDLVWLGAAIKVIGAEVLIECAAGDPMVGNRQKAPSDHCSAGGALMSCDESVCAITKV